VTNQRLGDNLAEHGWLAHPGLNRLTMFKGNVLHGVIPGRGIPDPDTRTSKRITFMCAFWEGITQKEFNRDLPCASQPFPYPGSSDYTCPEAFRSVRPSWGRAEKQVAALPQGLQTVWERVNAEGDRKLPERQPEASDKPWLAASLAFCATVTKGRPLEEVSPDELPDEVPSYDVVFQGF